MNFIKYFKNTAYQEGINDCWTFVQEIFKDEHNIILPDYPIMIKRGDVFSFLAENVPYKCIDKAQKGCVIYFKSGEIHHAGYALNDKEFIHKTVSGVTVSKIPKNATIYKVLYDKNN